MGTLAESVIGNAQQAQNQQSHTVGDAMQAFHIAATAEHAKQELDMEKQKQDINKGTWIASQYDKIGRTSGPAQQLMIDSFGKQMQQISPGFNPQILDVLKKDPDALRAMVSTSGREVSRGQLSPESSQALLAMHNGDLTDFLAQANKLGEMNSQVQAAQLKSAAMSGRVDVGNDNMTINAVKAIHDNPMMVQIKNQALALDKGMETLRTTQNPDGTMHKPTWTDINEFKQDYSKSLSGGSVSSDFKLQELGRPSYKQMLDEVESRAKSDPNQPASDAAVKFWLGQGTRLNSKFDNQLSMVSRSRLQGVDPALLHNQSVAPAMRQAIAPYQNGSWRKNSEALSGTNAELNPPQGAAAPAAPGGVMGFDQWKASQAQGQ